MSMSNPTSTFSRRSFLRRTATTTSGIGLALHLPGILTRPAFGAAGSEGIRIGCVGCGGQGNSDIRPLMKNMVALCDVDQQHLNATKATVEKATGRTMATYRDYRKMLESKEVDAVIIGTPDHWHTLPAYDACEAGKHVYCEKPLTLVIDEGKALVKAARRNKVVFQTGSQQRSDPKFRLGCELVRNGRIGQIKEVHVGLPGVNWTKEPMVPDGPPPAELDYEMWLGPAPYRPYNKWRVHYYFRFFWDYSGGQMTNWGAHHLDITQWGLGMDESGPVEIEATSTPDKEKQYEVPETFAITYRYGNGTVVRCHSGDSKYKMGARFVGEKGEIYVNRGALESTPEELIEQPLKEGDLRLYNSPSHHKNWLDCIISGKLPICDVAIGHRSATVCHLGNLAVRLGRKIKWDPVTEQVVGDDEAARRQRYAYRAPWKFPA